MGARLEVLSKEGSRLRGDSDDLVRRLAVELEVELGLRAPVLPVREGLELGATEAARSEPSAFDLDADARGLAVEILAQRNRLGVGDDAARDEAEAAFILAR